MAMIKCPECGRDVSDRAASCPQCGTPIASSGAYGPPQAMMMAPTSGYGMPVHLTREALLSRFPSITGQLPPQVRSLVTGGEEALYFNFIAQKGGCASGNTANQWLMVTTTRVAYQASVQEQREGLTTFVQTAGSILLPQISFVGTKEAKKAGCGCTNTAVYYLQINSSGGSIVIAMPTQAHVNQARQAIEAVLNPHR